jgi:hypothetical protein
VIITFWRNKVAYKSFPDKTAYPIVTPITIYWRGLDIISENLSRTKSYKNKKPGSDEFQEYMFWRKNLIIWTCSTIESFVNLEGVSWMGEQFYKDTIERQNIVQKIRLIYAIKYNKMLPSNKDMIKNVKEIFELRNQFVHPKTQKVKNESKDNQMVKKLNKFNPTKLKKLVRSVNTLLNK